MSRPSNTSQDFEKDNWIAEVSHELRLPLANIKLLVETLLDGAIEDKTTAMRMLNRTREEVTRLQNLVSDLLSHEKLQGHRDEMRMEQVDLHERVRSVIDTTAPLAGAKSIKVKAEVEKNCYFSANADQLDQVLMNLVENAIKFTPDAGLIIIRASANPPRLEVEDSGIGIPEAEIPKIFQRFYRVDRSRTRGSTGLGLSIVKHIVDLHGARISVTSREGEGTRFIIEFPPFAAEAADERSAHKKSAPDSLPEDSADKSVDSRSSRKNSGIK